MHKRLFAFIGLAAAALVSVAAANKEPLKKVWLPNGLMLGFVELARVEQALKILVLVASLGYTLWRWHKEAKEKK